MKKRILGTREEAVFHFYVGRWVEKKYLGKPPPALFFLPDTKVRVEYESDRERTQSGEGDLTERERERDRQRDRETKNK